MTQTAVMDKEAIKKAKEAKEAADLAFEKEANKDRSGVGTRLTVGYTRGKGSQRITYEAFDETQPDTLPKTTQAFMEATSKFGSEDDKNLLAWLIDGFNSAQYTAASDPASDFVKPHWPIEVQAKFKIAIKAHSAMLNVPLEESAALIGAGLDKAYPETK